MLKDPKPNKEEDEYLRKVQAKLPGNDMDDNTWYSGNWSEPKPGAKEESWRRRINAKWD